MRFTTILFSLIIFASNSMSAQITTLNNDSNNDGCVDLNDLLDLISEYGQCLTPFACGDAISQGSYSYSTVQIGTQCWFSENCNYLPTVSPSSVGSPTNPVYYVYGYQGTDVIQAKAHVNYLTYGVLYNLEAAIAPGICPAGWHVPNDSDFTVLSDFLGGEAVAGYKMKSSLGWLNGGNGSNSSGFTGLPSGYRNNGGGFSNVGEVGFYWTTTLYLGVSYWYRQLDDNYDSLFREKNNKELGFSVRCLMD